MRTLFSFVSIYVKYFLASDPVRLLLSTSSFHSSNCLYIAGFLSIRGSFIHSLYKTSLNPFNVRYDVLLRRWDEHQRLVELEISTCTGMEQLETAEKIDRILKKFSEKEMFEDDRHATWRNVGMCYLSCTGST